MFLGKNCFLVILNQISFQNQFSAFVKFSRDFYKKKFRNSVFQDLFLSLRCLKKKIENTVLRHVNTFTYFNSNLLFWALKILTKQFLNKNWGKLRPPAHFYWEFYPPPLSNSWIRPWITALFQILTESQFMYFRKCQKLLIYLIIFHKSEFWQDFAFGALFTE